MALTAMPAANPPIKLVSSKYIIPSFVRVWEWECISRQPGGRCLPLLLLFGAFTRETNANSHVPQVHLGAPAACLGVYEGAAEVPR